MTKFVRRMLAFPDPHKNRRRLYTLLALIVTLIPVALVLYARFGGPSPRERLAEYTASLRVRGYVASPRDFVQVGVPDEENAAVLLPKAVALSKPGPKLSWEDVIENPRALSPDQRLEVRKALEEDTPFFEALERVSECPYFTFEQQDFERPVYEWKVPKVTGVASRFRYLFASASVLAVDGEPEKAADLWCLGLRSSRHLLETPCVLLTFMLGMVVRGDALQSMDHVFKGRQTGSKILKAGIDLLQAGNWRESLIQSLHWERSNHLEVLARCLEDIPTGTLSSIGYPMDWITRFKLRIALMRPGVLVSEMIAMQEVDIRYIEIQNGKTSTWLPRAESIYSELGERKFPLLQRLGFQAIAGSLKVIAEDLLELETKTEVARVALACKAFRNDCGEWPETLIELAPAYIDPLPEDPYTNQPLLYRKEAEGFTVYGVGPDRSDDGADEKRDVVWREGS